MNARRNKSNNNHGETCYGWYFWVCNSDQHVKINCPNRQQRNESGIFLGEARHDKEVALVLF